MDRRKQDGEGPGKYFYGVIGQARGRFFRGRKPTVLLCDCFGFGGRKTFWSFHEFSSFHPNFLEFALCFFKVSNLNILTNIVHI